MRSFAVLVAALVAAGCAAPVDEERVGEVEEEAVVCGVGPTVPGIDVSYYQGKPDWKKVAGSGLGFAITRINDGSFMDPEFAPNYKAIRDNGMVRGSYQFFRSGHDPVEEAKLTIQKVGKLEPGDLAPVLDVEATDGASASAMSAKIETWVKEVEKGTGRKPFIYSGRYFWDDNVKSTALKDYPYWIPEYTSDKCPYLASAWKHWEIWQYSSTGSVPGISGHVDMNRLNGDALRLQDLAANGYRASVVSIDYPKSLEAGTSGAVVIELKNEGARAWTSKTKLGTSEQRDRKSPFAGPKWDAANRVLSIDGTVKPGQTATLKFTLVAPDKAGKYVEHFNLVEEGIAWFSDIVPGGGPSDDAIALSIEVKPASGGSSGGSGGSGAGGGGSSGSGGDASVAVGAGVGGGSSDIGVPIPNMNSKSSCAARPSETGGYGWLAALGVAALFARRRR